jgi:hypothetical protein
MRVGLVFHEHGAGNVSDLLRPAKRITVAEGNDPK